uniref:Uncharacterized protein n=1 Tax=Rhizophagus irregularis (strain DAOM 181602 / DAOM 197198 / MUCL 43194) TaxID=747089 RepID=U9TM53_RHIID
MFGEVDRGISGEGTDCFEGLRENRQNRTTFSLNTALGIVRWESSGINIQTHEIS